MSNQIYEFKALVHLNNAGVFLLQRGCYREAMETFGDSISVLKIAFLSSNLADAPIFRGSELAEEDTQMKIERAARRLSNPTPSSTPGQGIVIETISDNESPAVIEKSTPLCRKESDSFKNPEKIILHLVRMDPVDFEVPSSTELSVEAAILLYNYGIAYLCLSSLSTSTPFAEKLNEGAIHLFHLANMSLSSLLGDMDVASSNIQFKRILLMSVLSLKHLTNMSCIHESVRHEYAQQLDNLRPSVLSFIAMESQFVAQSSPAA